MYVGVHYLVKIGIGIGLGLSSHGQITQSLWVDWFLGWFLGQQLSAAPF